MNKGKIVQVMGPVVDVVFEQGELPDIREALEVENNGKKCIMEVSQHLGNRVVRCIMLSASEGLQRLSLIHILRKLWKQKLFLCYCV